MLNLVKNLFEKMDSNNIVYSHWKSNVRLESALNGVDDLDLLIGQGSFDSFVELINSMGFKQLKANPWDEYPFIKHYLGFDESSVKTIHLHVYQKLILGKKLLKSYCIPIENLVFKRLTRRYNVCIPEPEIEFILHVIRMAVKRTFDVAKEKEELNAIMSSCNNDRFMSALKEIERFSIATGPFLEIFKSFPDCNKSSFIRVKRSMGRFNRYSRFEEFSILFKRKAMRFLFKKRKKGLITGGKIIAIIGIDGAGKTTLNKKIKDILGWKLQVEVCYLGSNMLSLRRLICLPVNKIFRAFRKIFPFQPFKQLSLFGNWLLQYVNALDRLSRYSNAQKISRDGSIVLCDRFPIANVMDHYSTTDWDEGFELKTALVRKLSLALDSVYKKFDLPELAFYLALDPESAYKRKTDISNIKTISAKYSRVEDFYLANNSRVHKIDAGLPIDKVLSLVLKKIWDNI